MHCLMDVDLHKIENESPEYDIFISISALSQERPCHILLFAIASVHKLQPSSAKTHNQKACWGVHFRKTMWEGRNRSRLYCVIKDANWRWNMFLYDCHPRLQSTKKTNAKIKFNQAGCRSCRCESLYTKQHPNNQTPRPTSLRNEHRSRPRWAQKPVRSI